MVHGLTNPRGSYRAYGAMRHARHRAGISVAALAAVLLAVVLLAAVLFATVLIVVPPPTEAQAPVSGVGITNVFDAGEAYALALDSSDLPVLFAGEWTETDQFDEFELMNYIVRCADVACTASRSLSAVPFAVPASGAQMILDSQDRPVVVTFVAEAGVLNRWTCLDPACSSWESGTVELERPSDEDQPAGIVGLEYLEDGGLGAVVNTFLGDTAEAILLRCSNTSCTNVSFNTIGAEVSSYVLDPVGMPAYVADDRLVRCADTLCDIRAEALLPGTDGHVMFGDSGWPIVLVSSYIYNEAEFPRETYGLLMHCDDPLCIDEADHAVRVVENEIDLSHRHRDWPVDVYEGPHGFPVVAQYRNWGFDREWEHNIWYRLVPECIEVHCAGPPTAGTTRFFMARDYADRPTHFVTTAQDVAVVFSAGQHPFVSDRSNFAARVDACIPGSTCFVDENADGRPDWLEFRCRGEIVTVDLRLGDTPTQGDDIILGTGGDDVVSAGAGDDVVCGAGGDDLVWGQDGDDVVYGDDGADRLRGGDGDDKLFGGSGGDDLNGGRDDDEVWGQDGDDIAVRGGTGNDLVNGGFGNDTIVAGNGGEDRVFGSAGDDKVTGGPRPDEVNGGAGNDEVKGNGGRDSVHGDTGDDRLFGGPGSDALDGGADVDECNGGAGVDTQSGCEALVLVP